MVTVACLCPPKPGGEVRHPNGDRIALRDKLDFRSAQTARNEIVMAREEDPAASIGALMAALTETFLLVGVESWTLVDEKGKKIEVSKPAIRQYLLTNEDAAMAVAEAADELYGEAVTAPLARKAANSSQPTPTAAPTSVTNGASPTAPKPSKRSSTSTTRTGGIAATP